MVTNIINSSSLKSLDIYQLVEFIKSDSFSTNTYADSRVIYALTFGNSKFEGTEEEMKIFITGMISNAPKL